MRFKTVSGYSLLAYFNQACNVIINLFFIRLLSLPLLGEVALAKVWMQLMDYSHLGFRFALDRYVPVWEKERSEHLLWLCLVVTSVVSTVVISMALVFTDNPLLMGTFVLWGYCVSIATILKNYYRASGDNNRMLYTYAISSTLPIAVQATTVILFGFKWFLFLTVATYFIATAYLFSDKKIVSSVRNIDWKSTIQNVRSSALYLLLNSIVIFLSFSVDRLMLSHFSGKTVLGEYSVVLFGFSLLLIVPSTLAEFVFPKIVKKAAATGRIYFPREIAALLVPTIIAVFVAWMAIPVAIPLLTKYANLTGLMQLVTVGIIPYAVTPVLFHVMSARDMRPQLLIAACLTLIFYSAILAWGGKYATHILEFFTAARAGYGYLLLLMYCLFLIPHSQTTQS